MDEERLRNDPVCVGCGEHKGIGLLLCWDCFKGRKGKRTAYKNAGLTLQQWIDGCPAVPLSWSTRATVRWDHT